MKQDQKRLSKESHEQKYVQEQAMISLQCLKAAKVKSHEEVIIKAGKFKRYLEYILTHPKRRQTK